MDELEISFIKSVKQNYPKSADKILSAYEFARNAHKGVTRLSGEPYIVHPIHVAQILIDNDMDYASIMAGLLHDVVEDTDITLDDIKDRFGETVAKLVDGVTKISNFEKEKDEAEADSIKKLIISMGSDIRVIFIKLADRLHNMRTIEFLKPDKQIRFANETKELFIPLADKIGIRSIRSELENLVFKCLKPDEYNKIKEEFDKQYSRNAEKVQKVTKKLENMLQNNEIEGNVVCWPEHYYSLYKRSQTQGIGKVYGLMLYKIIVPTEEDCYKTLYYVHKEFTPLPEQIRDFIASPKLNGYKSLQTVVVSEETEIAFKVMIRTLAMDKVCEYGISALWQDKDSEIKFDESFEKFNVLKKIVDSENSELGNSTSFAKAIKNELTVNATWVFTPTFSPVRLTSDKPTAIDFAYALHTDIGNNAVGAKINGKPASLGTVLSTGDVVEVLLSDKPKAPSRTWLNFATTVLARKKIREYIIKHTTPKYVNEGKKLLSAELEKSKRTLGDIIKIFEEIKKDFEFINLDDMYASIGYGSITTAQILSYLKKKSQSGENDKNSPVIIEGSKNFVNISFPKCCGAIPGDEIVGILNRDSVAIHSKNCKNLPKMSGAQFVDAVWRKDIGQIFTARIKVVAKDSVGFAGRLFSMIGASGFNLTRMEAKMLNDTECEIVMSVGVKNKAELDGLISQVGTIEGIKDVTRFFD